MLKSYEKFKELKRIVLNDGKSRIIGDDYIGVCKIGVNEQINYAIFSYELNEIVVYIEDEKEDSDEVMILTINSMAFKNCMLHDKGIYGKIARDINSLLKK